MATKTAFYPTPTGKLTGNLVKLNAPKTQASSTPYFVPSPTGLPVTKSQTQFLSGVKSSSGSTPFYPTPTGAPISETPRTVGAGSKSGGEVLGASTSYNFQVPTTITPRLLSSNNSFSGTSTNFSPSASTITLPSSPGVSAVNFDMSSLLTPELASQGYTIQNGQFIAPQPVEGKQQDVSTFEKYLTKLKNALPKPEKKLDTLKRIEEQAKITEKQNTVNSLTQQLNAITSQQQADLLNLRNIGSKEGVTETVYGGQQLEINREAAIKALPIAAQLSAAQNDLQTAQSYVDRYFKVYSDDVDSEYKYQTDLINTAFNFADKEDQRKLAELKDKKDNEFTLKRDAINQANEIAKLALQNGQSSLYSQITALNPNDANYIQKVAQIGGQVAPKATESQKDQYAISSITSQLASAVGEDGYTDPNLYARLRASSTISATDFDNRFGYLVNPESRARLGLSTTKETTYTAEQIKQQVNKQQATQEWKDASKDDKRAYIYSLGGDPSDFGL